MLKNRYVFLMHLYLATKFGLCQSFLDSNVPDSVAETVGINNEKFHVVDLLHGLNILIAYILNWKVDILANIYKWCINFDI